VAAAGVIDRTSPIDERMKQAAITQWVLDMRGVTSDGWPNAAAIRSCLRDDWQSERSANNRDRVFPRESTLRARFPRNGAGGSERDFAELTAQHEVIGRKLSALSRRQTDRSASGRGIFTVAINPSTDEAV